MLLGRAFLALCFLASCFFHAHIIIHPSSFLQTTPNLSQEWQQQPHQQYQQRHEQDTNNNNKNINGNGNGNINTSNRIPNPTVDGTGITIDIDIDIDRGIDIGIEMEMDINTDIANNCHSKQEEEVPDLVPEDYDGTDTGTDTSLYQQQKQHQQQKQKQLQQHQESYHNENPIVNQPPSLDASLITSPGGQKKIPNVLLSSSPTTIATTIVEDHIAPSMVNSFDSDDEDDDEEDDNDNDSAIGAPPKKAIRTPTATPMTVKRATPLPSVLRNKPPSKTTATSSILRPTKQRFGGGNRPTTQRRVRGLWADDHTASATASSSPSSSSSLASTVATSTMPSRAPQDATNVKGQPICYFELLRNETTTEILSYLNLYDLCRFGMIGRRYKYLVQSESILWQHIDATVFVQRVYETFLSKARPTTKPTTTKEDGSTTKRDALPASPSLPPRRTTPRNTKEASVMTTTVTTATAAAAKTAAEQTGQALEETIKDRNIKSLTIRDIQHRLDANHYLPSYTGLEELVLTQFNNLTDTHVHVMLLMADHSNNLKKIGNSLGKSALRKLQLDRCPLLTNASIRSIAIKCPVLESVSICGCTNVDDVSPLAPLLKTTSMSPQLPNFSSAANKTPPSLAAFFQPPTLISASSAPSALFPPSTITRPPTSSGPIMNESNDANNSSNGSGNSNGTGMASSLQSLFAPPGMSPPRRKSTTVPLSPASTTKTSGLLCEVDFRNTSISATALIQCLREAAGGISSSSPSSSLSNSTKRSSLYQQQQKQTMLVSVKSLQINGDDWTDSNLQDLSELLALEELEVFNIATTRGGGGGGDATSKLSNKGLKVMARTATPKFSQLVTLNISGHHQVTGLGISSIVVGSPKLHTLALRDCCGVASDAKGMEKLLSSIHKQHSTLRQLNIQGCFKIQPPTSGCGVGTMISLQAKEWSCWQILCHKLLVAAAAAVVPNDDYQQQKQHPPSSLLQLHVLNVRDCWPIDQCRHDHNNDDNNNNNGDPMTQQSIRQWQSSIPIVLL